MPTGAAKTAPKTACQFVGSANFGRDAASFRIGAARKRIGAARIRICAAQIDFCAAWIGIGAAQIQNFCARIRKSAGQIPIASTTADECAAPIGIRAEEFRKFAGDFPIRAVSWRKCPALGAAFQNMPGLAMAPFQIEADALEADLQSLNDFIDQIRVLLIAIDAKAAPLDEKNKMALRTLSGLLQTSADKALLAQITGPTPQGPRPAPPAP
jgi:hypothetical protein